GSLSDKGRTELCVLLKRNLDIFAWQPFDMTGVPRSVAEHRLNVREGYPPIRQKKRGQAPERTKAIQAEVEKLVEAGIMREVYYHDWLSNPVMIKKHDGSWRMCVDFMDLNKACPHDCYPLPEIDWKVESLCGYPFKCFLDAYKGYHQIQMAAADEEKTAFHTGQGHKGICGRLGNKKSHRDENGKRHSGNIPNTTEDKYEAQPKKMFIRISGRSIPRSDFRWTTEADEAFQQLKKHLSALPMLAATKPQEELIMYLSATHGAISAVLLTERGTVQTPVYFISHALQGPELNYSPMKKLVLSLVIAAKRLRRYFQAHPIANWVEELPHVLWAYRTMVKSSHGDTPFSLTYGTEAVIPTEIGIPTYRTTAVDAVNNDEELRLNLDLLEERRELAAINEARSKSKMTKYYNSWVSGVAFQPGDFIYRSNDASHAAAGGKLGPKWEVAVNGRNDASQNMECRKPKAMLPLKIDNGKQFADNPLKDWCDKLNITQHFASVKHPQSNGLVERANRSLGEGIKARLGEGNKNWVEELPHVLWIHRTMVKSSHGDTPFSLTYGTEAVIPAEIRMPTYHTRAVDVVNNDEELRLNLDLLEERRELAAINEARSKSKMTKYYNSRARGVAFQPGDFIYCSNDASHAAASGKLDPKWEGPYEVADALENGAYKLQTRDETMLPRTWNVANLKRCYL
nr:reverse transcriptase domain-containing protein [Tanacetum cinerariifolium]